MIRGSADWINGISLSEKPASDVHGGFTTTHWTVVRAAKGGSSPDAEKALETLCRTYWHPLYAYIRREGHSPQDAEDLTQGFFARVLERGYLSDVSQERGKFRSFLLGCLRHFLSDKRDWEEAKKRGGGQKLVSLDEGSPEDRYCLEPVDVMDPERIFERRWALTVLERAGTQLHNEYERVGKAEQYERLKVFEMEDRGAPSYAEVATQLNMTESAVKSAIHRLRTRYVKLIRDEVAHTVSSPGEIDEEIRHLIEVVAN